LIYFDIGYINSIDGINTEIETVCEQVVSEWNRLFVGWIVD